MNRAIESLSIMAVAFVIGVLAISVHSFVASIHDVADVFGADGIAEIMEDRK